MLVAGAGRPCSLPSSARDGLARSRAQSRAAVVSLQYESPALAVPIAVVALRSDEGRELTLGVVGWTLGADWRRVDGPHRRRHLFVHVTPFNANSSDYFYRRRRA